MLDELLDVVFGWIGVVSEMVVAGADTDMLGSDIVSTGLLGTFGGRLMVWFVTWRERFSRPLVNRDVMLFWDSCICCCVSICDISMRFSISSYLSVLDNSMSLTR